MEHDIKNLKNDIGEIKVVQLENNVIPRLQNIEACYTSTYERYKNSVAYRFTQPLRNAVFIIKETS